VADGAKAVARLHVVGLATAVHARHTGFVFRCHCPGTGDSLDTFVCVGAACAAPAIVAVMATNPNKIFVFIVSSPCV
jgi:hypothetical protein